MNTYAICKPNGLTAEFRDGFSDRFGWPERYEEHGGSNFGTYLSGDDRINFAAVFFVVGEAFIDLGALKVREAANDVVDSAAVDD